MTISLKKITPHDIAQLSTDWQTLEQQANPQFFLSWKWIYSWLTQVIKQFTCYLLVVKNTDNVIGLGIFVERRITQHYCFARTQWLLHQTGEPEFDQIWIENNDFLIDQRYQQSILPRIWQFLEKYHAHVDEFIISLKKAAPQNETSPQLSKYQTGYTQQDIGFHIDLNTIHNLAEYLAQLSKNTRKQITRSIKLLTSQGKLSFNVITDIEQQLEQLSQSQHWHIDKWQPTNTQSGFINPHFTDFHQRLIKQTHVSASTLVAQLQLNDQVIGVLYCFVQQPSCYFYLSSIQPLTDNRIKLGLVLHSLLIEWLTEQMPTLRYYDFLAGEARYKRSLTKTTDSYYSLLIQKKTLKFTIENVLKKLKEKLF